MFGKKKKETPVQEEGVFNPYFGKTKDESHMPARPFFMWLFLIPGLILGLVLAIGTKEYITGTLCGLVMGMAAGSMIDKFLEKRRNKRDGDQ